MNDSRNHQRDSLRSAGYWRRVLRAMAAVGSVRLAIRLALAAILGLVLLLGWWTG